MSIVYLLNGNTSLLYSSKNTLHYFHRLPFLLHYWWKCLSNSSLPFKFILLKYFSKNILLYWSVLSAFTSSLVMNRDILSLFLKKSLFFCFNSLYTHSTLLLMLWNALVLSMKWGKWVQNYLTLSKYLKGGLNGYSNKYSNTIHTLSTPISSMGLSKYSKND